MVDAHWAKIHVEYKAQVQIEWFSNSNVSVWKR